MSVTRLQGGTSAAGLRVAIVASRFNAEVTDKLTAGAIDALKKAGAREEDLTVISVPGAWEIPFAVHALMAKDQVDAIVAVGAIIKGETTHDHWVAAGAIEGVSALVRESGLPVGLAILTTDTEEQALARAGGKHGNKGAEAALAVVEMADLRRKLTR